METKSFTISKRLVWEAYKRVKANAGAAGVDGRPVTAANLTRFLGVLAPNGSHRLAVTPAKRGKGGVSRAGTSINKISAACAHRAMTWAERLKRAFNIDITRRTQCAGVVKLIARSEDPPSSRRYYGTIWPPTARQWLFRLRCRNQAHHRC